MIFGFIYLGAAVYFLYGFVQPRWSNAAGQLIGFLAYDIVLIGPFVDRFDEVTGRQLLSLIIYSAVLVFSGALAFYYLFVGENCFINRIPIYCSLPAIRKTFLIQFQKQPLRPFVIVRVRSIHFARPVE